MSDTNAIVERLSTLFVETFNIEAPAADADLLQAGILDSLQFVELLVRLEQSFDLRIKIDNINLDDLRTLAQIARLIAANSTSVEATASPSLPGATPLGGAAA